MDGDDPQPQPHQSHLHPAVAREIAELIVDRYGPVFQQLADLMQRRVGER